MSSAPKDLLTAQPPDESLDWARRQVDDRARLIEVRPLFGGISHANHALDIVDEDGHVHELVLRRWVRPEWMTDDPHASPDQETATYGLLAGSAVPAPQLMAADPVGRECDAPAILITRLPGHAPLDHIAVDGLVRGLASALHLVHAVDPARARSTVPPYRPYYATTGIAVPARTASPWLWQRAIEISMRSSPEGHSSFIHRDYHPGNTLWRGARLVGIVDWTSASWGPREIDLGHMRTNLVIDLGSEVADAFLGAYMADDPQAYDSFWDVRSVVDFVSDFTADETKFERLEDHLAVALSRSG
jgi:aminoglycoside phosphotransferase (APT) family kinase protein